MKSKQFYLLGMCLLLIGSELFSQIPTNGLVAYYPFSGNANDASGNGNNGTVNGVTLTADHLGNANSAYSFNGSSDYIALPSGNSTSLNITSDFTVSCWIKTTDNIGLIAVLNNSVTAPYEGYGTRLSNGKMDANTRGSWSSSTINTLSDNNWHYVVVLLKADTLKFYIDNTFDNQVTGLLTPLSWNGNRVLGCRSDLLMTAATNYGGILDDLAIYNRAITQQEIAHIYSALPLNNSDTTVCISSTTGTDGNGWSYADYVIPAGYKIDSVYGDFDRTGYPAFQQDFIFEYCPNSATYVLGTATLPFNYQTVNTSLYKTWINLTAFSYTAPGVIRVRLPTNSGASWNDFCIALSHTCNVLPTVTFTLPAFINNNASPITLNGSPTGGTYTGVAGITGITLNPSQAGLGNKQITYSYTDGNTCSNSASASTIVYDTTGVVCSTFDTITAYDTVTTHLSVTDTLIINALLTGVNPPNNINTLKLYPNPASDHLVIDCGNITQMTGYTIKITNSIGQVMFQSAVTQQVFNINLSGWAGNGIYVFTLTDAQQTVIETKQIVLQ